MFKQNLMGGTLIVFFLLFSATVNAQVQTFSAAIGSTIDLTGANGSCATPGAGAPNIIPILVSNVGTLSASNAVTQIKVTLNNTCTGSSTNLNNLQFRLKSPTGTCVGVYSGGLSTTATGTHELILVTNTSCLNNPDANASNVAGVSASASSNYGFFNAQFNGTPTDLTTIFSGENADGTWQLVFSETTTSEPCLAAASLVFGNPTVDDQTPNGNDCTGAIVWDGGAICASTDSKTGSVLMPGSLTGANGTSFGTIGGITCDWNQANNNDVWLKFTPTSTNVCISISGLDFSLQSIVVQDANQDGDNNPCTANTVGIANDQRWTVVSCPNNALYTTTAGTQKNQNHCFTAVVGQTYYLIVDGNGGAESPFYIGAVSGLPATEPAGCTVNLSYPATSSCLSGSLSPTFSPAGGVFTATTGLSIDATTGVINLAASTATTHTITYTPNIADPSCFATFDLTTISNGFGAFASATAISANSTNTVYNTTGSGADEINPGGPNLNNSNLGSFDPNSGQLKIFGGEIKTFKNIGNVCSANMYYRVYKVGDAPGAFTQVNLTTISECVDTDTNGTPDTFDDGLGPCSPNDQKWKDYTFNIDLTQRCVGNYQLEVYYDYTGSGCSSSQCNETKLINNAGNNYIASFSINDVAAPTASVSAQPTCLLATGTITVTAPTASQGISYTITGNTTATNTTGIFSGLSTGDYDVTATVMGCTSLITNLTVNPQPSTPSVAVTTTTPNSNCTGAGNGGIDITVSGGVSPYTYGWSNGTSNQDLSTVSGGTYTVTVTGNNGCTAVGSATVGSSPSLPSIAASPTITPNSNCTGAGNGGIDITVSGGTSPYTYGWSNGTSNQDLSTVSGGTYTVTVTGNNGCTAVGSATVGSSPSLPSIAASPTITPNSNCTGAGNGAIDITVSGGTSPYTYGWSNGTSNQDLTTISGGTYTVTVTGNNGCTAVGSATVGSSPSLPSIAASPTITPNSNCTGAGNGGIDITVSGGTSPYTYGWSNGTSNQDLSTVSGGTYTVTVTGNNGCTAVGSATVGSSPSLPSIAASPTITPNSNCTGAGNGGIDITVSGGASPYTYGWSNGTSNQDLSTVSGGTYTVTVTGNNGCTAVGNATVGSSPSLPTAGINQPTNTVITCNITSIGLTATGGGGYLWNAVGGNATTANILATAAGTYVVTVTGANGCTSSTSIAISSNTTSPTSPTAIVNNVLCNGGATGSINLTPNGGIAPYTFIWSNGNTTEDISGLTAGTYSVTVSGTNGCNRVASFSVSQPSALTATVQTTASCPGVNVGAINVTASGGTAPYTYELLNTTCLVVQSTNNNGLFSNLTAGNYCVRVRDANNCLFNQSGVTVGSASGGPVLVSSENTDEGLGGVTPFAYNKHVIVVEGGTLPYDFEWNNSGYVRYDVQYTATGCIITIFYTDDADWDVSITDGGSCTSAPIVIDNNANNGSSGSNEPLDIYNYNITAANGLAGGSIQLFVEGGVACAGNVYYYEWTTPTGNTINTSGSSPTTLNNQPSGWYSVVVTDCGNDGIHGNTDDQETIGWYWIPKQTRGRGKTEVVNGLNVSPNPFNGLASVEFYTAQAEKANITVYATDGKKVAVLFDAETKANETQSVVFNADNLAAGVYAVILSTESGVVKTFKTLIVR
jgi:hypothetical protein